MNYQDKAAQLRSRLDDLDIQLAALASQRKEHAYAAATGEAKAVQTIAELNDEMTTLGQERQTILDAAERCNVLLKEQEDEAEHKARLQREADARQHSANILSISGEIDHKLQELKVLFDKRAASLSALGLTRTIPSNTLNRLHGKLGATAAVRHFGLHNYIATEHVPPHVVAPLVDCTSVLKLPATKQTTSERYKPEVAA